MGFFKDLFGGGLKTSGSPEGAMLAKMANQHPELQGGDQKKYTYDADKQQYTAMKKGGTASSRADGCVTKGKTKGRFV